MKTLPRFVLALTTLLLLAYYVPAGYWLVAEKVRRAPNIQYSCVNNSFLFYRHDGDGVRMTDGTGKEYERSEFEALLPLLHWAQLAKEGRLPKSIGGVDLGIDKIRRAQFSARLRSEELNMPSVPLYPLLEAESGRVRLEMPGDTMRLSTGIAFLDPETRSVIEGKTALFAKAFEKAGFKFPVRVIGGNPTNKKPYDEGFYLADAQGEIFRLRQVKGAPELLRLAGDLAKDAHANSWKGLKPRAFIVQESDSRSLRVLILDEEGRLHLALGPDYRPVTLPLQTYDPSRSVLTIRGDLLNRLVVCDSGDRIEALAFDRDFNLLATHLEPVPARENLPAGRLARHLFPFMLRMEDSSSSFFGVYVDWGSALAFATNGVLLLLVLVWRRLKKLPLRTRWPDLAVIAFGGVLGLVSAVLLPKSD